ncbi:MAG: 4Fe-4S binding protein [Flavobacteriaceae bacterium]|nr:4Fe-4S binding protein [Flavobacteriaceae bacterium]
MSKTKGEIVVDIERCKGCEICVPVCQEGVIVMTKQVNRKGYHFAISVTDACTGCTNCAVVCPDGAISVYRKKFND